MKITSVKTILVQHRLPRAIGPSTFMYTMRDSLLVKITTDEGLVGWGETAVLAGVRSWVDELAVGLIGQNPLDHRKMWRQLWGANFGNGLAVGGLDIALHDLRGKALGQSIGDMYGGRLKERVPLYCSAMNYTEGLDPLKHYPEEAAGLVKRGLRAMKMRLGGLPISRDAATAAAVRQAVGPDIKLMADGNGAYTVHGAIQMGRELDRLGFYWFEEPLPEAHYAGYERLRDKLEIALAGGEVLDSRGAARDLLDRGCFDIIQPDPSLCGGIGECLFISEMARLWSVPSNPHCWAGAIAIAATLHVLSLLPDASWARTTEPPMLEYDVYENPFRDELVRKPIVIKEGFAEVPTGPGLGIEVDEDMIRKYEVR